jgi:hypothetical protein
MQFDISFRQIPAKQSSAPIIFAEIKYAAQTDSRSARFALLSVARNTQGAFESSRQIRFSTGFPDTHSGATMNSAGLSLLVGGLAFVVSGLIFLLPTGSRRPAGKSRTDENLQTINRYLREIRQQRNDYIERFSHGADTA